MSTPKQRPDDNPAAVKSIAKAIPAASCVVVVGILALVTWYVTDRQLSRRALAAHMENGKAYAARVLEQVGTLPDELNESSGLVVSRTQSGVLWSHNDSGGGPRLYAIDSSGRLLAIIPVTNADARDWEDMASGPCPGLITATFREGAAEDHVIARALTSCLYVADIGDNDRVRDELTVYVVVEPRIDRTGERPSPVAARSFRYRYPDEPHDSEALAVLPDGSVTIVSKGRTGTVNFFGISAASVAGALASGQVLIAEYGGDAGIEPDARIGRLVTGAALSLDGKTLAVRTYNEVFFYSVAQVGEKANRWQRLGRPCFLGDAEPQGEAIDYLDNETLLLTSERTLGLPGTIHRLQC